MKCRTAASRSRRPCPTDLEPPQPADWAAVPTASLHLAYFRRRRLHSSRPGSPTPPSARLVGDRPDLQRAPGGRPAGVSAALPTRRRRRLTLRTPPALGGSLKVVGPGGVLLDDPAPAAGTRILKLLGSGPEQVVTLQYSFPVHWGKKKKNWGRPRPCLSRPWTRLKGGDEGRAGVVRSGAAAAAAGRGLVRAGPGRGPELTPAARAGSGRPAVAGLRR